MFKWMISGHKGHKHKQEKLNNALNNKNKNNLKHQQQNNSAEEEQLHITEANSNNAYNNQVNNTQEQTAVEQQNSGDINQNVEKCDNVANSNGLSGNADSDAPPPPPSSRPPPPPSHPPPPVPPHGQPLQQSLSQHPQPPLPPVPGQEEERPLQAPGTCTLPRRGFTREEPGQRYRSPSNPPPASRQPYQPPPQHHPPPYSRHQPPDPTSSRRTSRGPYQPPPPPKIDPRDPREGREHDLRDADVRNPSRDPRDSRDHQWDGRDFRGGQDSHEHMQDGRNFRDLRDSWERRNAGDFPRDERKIEDMKTSSLPRGGYEAWAAAQGTSRWSTREPDSGFDSLNAPVDNAGPRSLDSVNGRGGRRGCPPPSEDATYSQSTEDLLNASRTSPVSIASATTSTSSSSSSPVQYPTIRPAKQPCTNGTSHNSNHLSGRSHPSPHTPPGGSSPLSLGGPQHHSTPLGPPRAPSPHEEALMSDSVYPDAQPRYAEIPDMNHRPKEERVSNRMSRDMRDVRDLRDARDTRESRKDMRESRDNLRARGFRETSLPRDFRDTRDSRGSYMEVREDGFRELSVDDPDDHDDHLDPRLQERLRGRRESRQYSSERTVDPSKEVRFSSDRNEGLRVRDIPAASAYERRDRNADGADGLQVMEDHRSQMNSRSQQNERRGDGCTSTSSVSWMEWTQQLQAYVAWVNSQLRKRGRPLITDLRRDLQSGVVFADLIEIISGERVAGVTRDVDSPQVMRENLDRVLQFMAAKRIRMTHITSKEVVEGNLKSVMRIILALAAHYKPQSVKGNNGGSTSASPQHHQENSTSSTSVSAAVVSSSSSSASRSAAGAPPPATHDVGVGPDGPPSSAPEKTPNLSTNRRMIATGASAEDAGGVVGLRRHPSMTGTPAAARDSSPVYENLPRRVAPNRWAYDSLRASHKFQWGGGSSSHSRRGPGGAPVVPPKPSPNLDESSDDPLNTSFNTSLNTSLNTSMEADAEMSPRRDSSGSRGANTRPAALNFWQDLTRKDSNPHQPQESHQAPATTQSQGQGSEDGDNPFRYHTIHRMSGRRKLPQIPGAAAGPGSSRVTTPQENQDSPRGNSDYMGDERNGSSTTDEGSREPEGRSQNSSPATSLVREATLDQWAREKTSMDHWEQEDLKGVLRDLNTTRDQLLALQNLLLTPAEVESRGVSTTKISPITSPVTISPTVVSPTHDRPSKTEAPLKESPAKDSSSAKEKPSKERHGSTRESHKSRGHHASKRHSRQELDPSSRNNHGSRTSEIKDGTPSSVKQELLHLSLARQALEAEKGELSRLLEQREGIITELRKQMHQKDKTIQAQRVQFEETIRNTQNGKRESSAARLGITGGAREELQLVRDAISSLRSNFRETDPNQHTLDTLEQAIAVLIERAGNGSGGVLNGVADKTSRPNGDKRQVNGVNDSSTKVIYFTERTVTPFMSTINKRLGDIRLRDFKNMFDRPGLFRFHFKSHDPEYGMVKEEIFSDDDILPGVDGKIIAWVEEDTE